MYGGKEGREGREGGEGGREEEVKPCREPFSMEKPFAAMWEVKLLCSSTRVRGQLLSMTSIQERDQLKPKCDTYRGEKMFRGSRNECI